MGESRFVSGGRYAPPSAWIARLGEIGFEVELPPDERPLVGGDFPIRFRHADVTGAESAAIEMLFAYRALPEDAPRELLDLVEQRVEAAIALERPFFTFANSLTGLAWARGGRRGLVEAFERLRKEGIYVSEEDVATWTQIDSWSQAIELCVYGHRFCGVVAEDVIARAVADVTGGTLGTKKESYLVDASGVAALLEAHRDVPRQWQWDETESAQWLTFDRFESWEKLREDEDEA